MISTAPAAREAATRARWVEHYRSLPTWKLIALTTGLRIAARRGHATDVEIRFQVLEAEQARRAGIGRAVEAAYEEALAIESLAESTIPNLVGAMEWALERIGTRHERSWMWTMAREMEWALNARGFETVPDVAHAAALASQEYRDLGKAYLAR